jgi:hypothetical protein
MKYDTIGWRLLGHLLAVLPWWGCVASVGLTMWCFFGRESSLHVTNTTYSGLQEHRTIVYTATGQKAKPKVHLSMESTVVGVSPETFLLLLLQL